MTSEPPSQTMPPAWVLWTCLALLMVLAAWLRIWGTWDQGLTSFDEGFYANVARGPRLAVEWIGQNGLSQGLGSVYHYLHQMGVEFSGMKAGHLFLMMLSMLILGGSDFAALVPVILCGLVSLALVYYLGLKFFSWRTALIALAFLAASPVHAAYSRNPLPQTDTMLFFLASAYFYFRSLPAEKTGGPPPDQTKSLLLASLMCGIALIMHPSSLSAAMGLFICEGLYFLLSHRNFKLLARRGLLLGALMLVPLVLVEGSALLLKVLGDFNVETTLGYFFRGGEDALASKTRFQLIKLAYFPNFIFWLEGALVAGLCVLGVVWVGIKAFGQRNPRLIALWSLVVWQLAFWSFGYATLKAIMVVYPLLALIMGLGVDYLLTWMAKRELARPGLAGLVVGLVVLALVWGGTTRSIGLLGHKNGYQAAASQLAAYIAKNGGVFSLADTTFHIHPVIRFYMGQARSRLPRGKQKNIVLTLDKPVRGDYFFYEKGEKIRNFDNTQARAMIKRLKPIITVPHRQNPFPPTFTMHRNWLTSPPYRGLGAPPTDRVIRIYDLRQLPGHKPSKGLGAKS